MDREPIEILYEVVTRKQCPKCGHSGLQFAMKLRDGLSGYCGGRHLYTSDYSRAKCRRCRARFLVKREETEAARLTRETQVILDGLVEKSPEFREFLGSVQK